MQSVCVLFRGKGGPGSPKRVLGELDPVFLDTGLGDNT
jgi:hypothetical protein